MAHSLLTLPGDRGEQRAVMSAAMQGRAVALARGRTKKRLNALTAVLCGGVPALATPSPPRIQSRRGDASSLELEESGAVPCAGSPGRGGPPESNWLFTFGEAWLYW